MGGGSMWTWNLEMIKPSIELPTCNLNSSSKPISRYSPALLHRLSNFKKAANTARFTTWAAWRGFTDAVSSFHFYILERGWFIHSIQCESNLKCEKLE